MAAQAALSTEDAPPCKFTRDLNAEARYHARALMGTPEFAISRDERKKVGMRLLDREIFQSLR
jgi:hypothetical protein